MHLCADATYQCMHQVHSTFTFRVRIKIRVSCSVGIVSGVAGGEQKSQDLIFVARSSAMLCKHGLRRHAVSMCLSVCLSVRFVNSVKTKKHIFKTFSPSGSHTFLVFPCQTA